MITSNYFVSIRILTTERDWKFMLIQLFNNNGKYFLDEVEIYLIVNFIVPATRGRADIKMPLCLSAPLWKSLI